MRSFTVLQSVEKMAGQAAVEQRLLVEQAVAR
jgi:hypothetical protein